MAMPPMVHAEGRPARADNALPNTYYVLLRSVLFSPTYLSPHALPSASDY